MCLCVCVWGGLYACGQRTVSAGSPPRDFAFEHFDAFTRVYLLALEESSRLTKLFFVDIAHDGTHTVDNWVVGRLPN